MTITAKYLREWDKSNFTTITAGQKQIIIDRFSTEPDPYEWSEQDIAVQIRNFLNCGNWEKLMVDNSHEGVSLLNEDEIPF